MIDISNHIIARNRWSKPDTHKESFQILMQNGVIEEKYVDAYSTMAKFRNRIVHMYYDVNDELVYKVIKDNLSDFQSFINSIGSILRG
jgi:uncharacterized protein YutE (UPF0331/DUF86 family)